MLIRIRRSSHEHSPLKKRERHSPCCACSRWRGSRLAALDAVRGSRVVIGLRRAGSRVLFSRIEGFEEEILKIRQYPIAEKAERIKRFHAQLEAWHWYCGEARKQGNRYLLGTAVSKLILFGGRLLLAHNEMLYPYHKWFLKVLERARDKPSDLMACIQVLTESPTAENVEVFYQKIKTFQPWNENPYGWGAQFMLDSELNWMDRKTPVDDL